MSKKQPIFINDDADRLMSMEETASRLGTSRNFIKRLTDAGLLPSLVFKARRRRISKISFNEFVKKYQGYDLYEVLEQKEKEIKFGVKEFKDVNQ